MRPNSGFLRRREKYESNRCNRGRRLIHPQRLQGLAPVSGAEEGLGHVQVKEVDGLAAQFRQCLGEIKGNLAFAAARLAQENNTIRCSLGIIRV